MTVSIVLPTYNRAYILPEALESVFQQTYRDFELIVVDDGSGDDTPELLKKVSDTRLRVIRHPRNAGYAAALNTGVAAATGDLIAFEDSDDLWKPEKLEFEVNFLAGHPEVAGVFCDMEGVAGTRRTISRAREYPVFSKMLRSGEQTNGVVFSQRDLYLCLLEEMPMKLQGSTFRAEALRRTGTFRETWKSGPDWEFMLRLARSYSLGYIDRPLAVLRTLPDSTLTRYKKEDALCLMERFIAEERELKEDPQARAAARRSIVSFANELGWECLAEGNRKEAVRAYFRGFWVAGDFGLLTRCAGVLLPRSARSLVKLIKQAIA